MINREQAQAFAEEWIAAWNAHDLDRVLSHYTEDFEMSSPFIATLTDEVSGTLQGRGPVGNYWRGALERMPDLHFELVDVLTGVNSIVIYYRAVLGKLAAETLFFDPNGKVWRGMAHYD